MKKKAPVKQPLTIKKAFRASFIIHFIFFWLMLGMPLGCVPGCGGGGGKGNSKEQQKKKEGMNDPNPQERIKEKDITPTEIDLVYTKPHEKTKAEIQQEVWKQHIEECPHYFGGVGIEWGSSGVVQICYRGYPAYEAGIRAGDYILNDEPIRGEIGTSIEIRYLRDGIEHTVTVIRGKICLEDAVKEHNGEDTTINP